MTIAKARELRKNPTEAELALWKHMRRLQIGGFKFRRQVPIGSYIVDFVCFEKRLIVELDGGQHQERAEYDAQRTRWLESQGFQVLRFWNTEALQQIEGVKQAILLALEENCDPLPLTPSRRGRENVTPSPLAGEGWGEGNGE